MASWRRAILSAAVLATAPLAVGCAGQSAPFSRPTASPRVSAGARPDPRLAEVVASAAAQIRRCYRAPPGVGHLGQQITTVLGVHYAPDGSLVGLPELRGQSGVTPENRVYAEQMAQAASLAVMQCAPIRMPAEYYQGGWDMFELTFSFGAAA